MILGESAVNARIESTAELDRQQSVESSGSGLETSKVRKGEDVEAKADGHGSTGELVQRARDKQLNDQLTGSQLEDHSRISPRIGGRRRKERRRRVGEGGGRKDEGILSPDGCVVKERKCRDVAELKVITADQVSRTKKVRAPYERLITLYEEVNGPVWIWLVSFLYKKITTAVGTWR